MEERICGKDAFWLSLEWKREEAMDGDSGDDGNDELTCVRLDESEWVSEQFLNGTSAHIRLFSVLPCYVMVDLDKKGDICKAI